MIGLGDQEFMRNTYIKAMRHDNSQILRQKLG